MYQNKVNLSLTFSQRLGHQAHNCKMAYYRERPPPPPPPECLKQIKQHIELAIQTSLMTLCYMSDLLPVFSYNFVHRDGGWQQSSMVRNITPHYTSLLGFFPITLERNVWIHGRQISHLVYNFYSSS